MYLGTRQSPNAHALLAVSEESICRLGLDELAQEGIYQVKPDKEVNSAVLELVQVQEVKQTDLTTSQQSWGEQIATRIGLECELAKLDFQLDTSVDKKAFKRGREAAKWAAKPSL